MILSFGIRAICRGYASFTEYCPVDSSKKYGCMTMNQSNWLTYIEPGCGGWKGLQSCTTSQHGGLWIFWGCERVPSYSRLSFELWTNPGYVSDSTAQSYRDYILPLIRVPVNQPVQWNVTRVSYNGDRSLLVINYKCLILVGFNTWWWILNKGL